MDKVMRVTLVVLALLLCVSVATAQKAVGVIMVTKVVRFEIRSQGVVVMDSTIYLHAPITFEQAETTAEDLRAKIAEVGVDKIVVKDSDGEREPKVPDDLKPTPDVGAGAEGGFFDGLLDMILPGR